MTLTYELDMDTLEKYLHSNNELSGSRLSEVRAQTHTHTHTNIQTDTRDLTHDRAAFAGGKYVYHVCHYVNTLNN